MIEQISKLDNKDLLLIGIAIVVVIALNIILLLHIRNLGQEITKETLNMKLKRIYRELEHKVFFRVQDVDKTVSNNDQIKAILSSDSVDKTVKQKVDLVLNNTKNILNANTVYLMDQRGDVIAGTNYGKTDKSFVGNNYSFRPYFKEAMKGENYVYGAVGKTSGQRGFYFSSPVEVDSKILGVIVIKMDLKVVDKLLNQFNNRMILLSPQGIVFATNYKNYLYKSFSFPGQEFLYTPEIKEQFGGRSIVPLSIDFSNNQVEFSGQEYLYKSFVINISNWRLMAFEAKEGFFYHSKNRRLFALISFVIIVLGATIVFLLINRFYRVKLEKELRKFLQIVEQSPVSVVITNLEGKIEYVNQAFEEVTGYQREEVLGENPNILKTDKHDEEYYQDLWSTIKEGKTWHGEFYNQKKNGDYYWEEAKINPLINTSGEIEAFIGIKEDITEEKQLKDKLEFFAERDDLTNLYNRRVAYQIMNEYKQRVDELGGCFSVAFIDINNLKVVNDLHGHETGDELILNVINTVQEVTRNSDTVSRFGGDEFIIIFDKTPQKHVKTVLDRIQTKLEEKNSSGQYNYRISISYGIEEYRQNKKVSIDDLVSMADNKMYQYKQKYKEENDLPKR